MSQPTTRVVFLGASNLSRGLPSAVATAQRTVGARVDFSLAIGHGRSYGRRSTVLGRGLPGITECGLWDALREGTGPPTFALVTDIGNDVIYGSTADEIAGWVETCLDRLGETGARVVLTLPPMVSLRRLTPWRFRVARTVLFPGSRLSLDDAMATLEELTARLQGNAARRNVHVLDPQAGWYGIDPIHLRPTRITAAWITMMSHWEKTPEKTPGGFFGSKKTPGVFSGVLGGLWLRSLTPQQWWLLGRSLGRAQPAGRLPDGSTVSLY